MEKFISRILFAMKQLCYEQMRRIAIGMTSAYLPPVVPRRELTGNPQTPAPIRFGLRRGSRFTWQRQLVRHSH